MFLAKPSQIKNKEDIMKKITLKTVARQAIVAALYFALSSLSQALGLASNAIQFRISEVLLLLCFFNLDYIYGIAIGTFLFNYFLGGLGVVDAFFGTIASIIAMVLINKAKNLYVASIFPAITNGIIVGTELYFYFEFKDISYPLTMLFVAIGELLVVSVVGVILFKNLQKNNAFMDIIENKREI